MSKGKSVSFRLKSEPLKLPRASENINPSVQRTYISPLCKILVATDQHFEENYVMQNYGSSNGLNIC